MRQGQIKDFFNKPKGPVTMEAPNGHEAELLTKEPKVIEDQPENGSQLEEEKAQLSQEEREELDKDIEEDQENAGLLGTRKSSRLQGREKPKREEDEDYMMDDLDELSAESDYEPWNQRRAPKKKVVKKKANQPGEACELPDIRNPRIVLNAMMNAVASPQQLEAIRQDIKKHQRHVEEEYTAVTIGNQENPIVKRMIEKAKKNIPRQCVPINGDVKTFNFKEFASTVQGLKGRYFDAIMMDPPWELSSATPTRGVAIGYDTLADDGIKKMDVPCIQDAGFILIWVINAKFVSGLKLLESWGYEYCTVINWIKQTKTGGIAKGHGFYLQHAKESCIVGKKNIDKMPIEVKTNLGLDIIFSRRQGQSQKPKEIYQLIQKVMPDCFPLEIFGRRNNLRDFWVTLGNEI